MSLQFTLSSIFELFLAAAVIWGVFNEDKLISFEKRIISNIKRRRLRVVKPANSPTFEIN